MFTDPRIERLRAYRLEEDISYDELAQRMNRAGYAIRVRALHLALTGRLRTLPRERTLYKISQFVEHISRQAIRRLRVRRAKTTATTKRKKNRRIAG